MDELHIPAHVLGIVPLKIITDKVLSYSFASIENTAKKFWFVF